jgi:hypothetical protein
MVMPFLYCRCDIEKARKIILLLNKKTNKNYAHLLENRKFIKLFNKTRPLSNNHVLINSLILDRIKSEASDPLLLQKRLRMASVMHINGAIQHT